MKGGIKIVTHSEEVKIKLPTASVNRSILTIQTGATRRQHRLPGATGRNRGYQGPPGGSKGYQGLLGGIEAIMGHQEAVKATMGQRRQ